MFCLVIASANSRNTIDIDVRDTIDIKDHVMVGTNFSCQCFQILTMQKGLKTKCGYVTKYVIATYFLELFYKEIYVSLVYVISFDKSLNRTLKKSQINILVRFWNNQLN